MTILNAGRNGVIKKEVGFLEVGTNYGRPNFYMWNGWFFLFMVVLAYSSKVWELALLGTPEVVD
jgi:hypothetical protein